MILVALFACGSGTIDIKQDTGPTSGTDPTNPTDPEPNETEETEPPPPVAPSLVVTAPGAFDPVAGAALDVLVEADRAAALYVEIVDAEGTVVASADAAEGDSLGTAWSGNHPDGGWATAGAYTLRATATADGLTTEVEQAVHLVRCGLVTVYADDDGVTGTRVPMWWHGDDALQDVNAPIASIERMEDDLGAPIPLPAVMDAAARPTDGLTEPVAYVWDSRPILTLVLGDSVVFAGTGLDGVDVGVRVDGWSVVSGVPVRPGDPIVLQKDAAIAETLGVTDLDLPVVFTIEDAGATRDVATTSVPLRFLAMLDEPTFDNGDEQYEAWVAAVEPALRGIDGTSPDHTAALDALVGWIFNDLGLTYDTRYGASAYTTYSGGDWERANFYMSSFLDRDYGDTVNCTDCAGILGNYANMIGAYLGYVIINPSFDLNQILAIGQEEFTNCPFGPRGCGFSYHAVTTHDGAATIWDATLAIDGDGDPGSLPSTAVLVQHMTGEDYLDAIVMSGNPLYRYESQGSMQ